jgi:hypothetical protein
VGEANDGLRGGLFSGLEGSSAGELVFLRLRAGSSMITGVIDTAYKYVENTVVLGVPG